jgi:hypothetical protein
MKPITHLNYPINKDRLLVLADSIKNVASPYTDPRYPDAVLDTWLILKYNDDYIEQIMDDFGVKGSPRFYWQEPNSVLPMHVDNNTTCSINFVLTDDPAPVTVEDVDYVYEQAVLDTTKLHGVNTNDEERILLKISIFDESYEDLVKRIPFVV